MKSAAWGTLKKLRVEIKHNPYVKPIVYSPITLVIEIVFSLPERELEIL